ncbi:MAG: hypothetical protein HY887_01805 [Deltaproteobacteria bacterium]|nr:hypothetical protein [Deltaproteobacteria bacterium]
MFSQRGARTAVALFTAIFFSSCAAAYVAKEADELAGKGIWDQAAVKYKELYVREPESTEYRMKYLRARVEAARMHFAEGSAYLEAGDYEKALLEFQSALLFDPGLDKAAASLKKVKRLMDSLYYYGKAVEFLDRGDERQAMAALKRSVILNPENQAALAELERLKHRAKLTMDGHELNLKSSEPITIEFRDADLKKVFDAIAKLSGINFVFDSEVRDVKTTVSLRGAAFDQALELILMTNSLARKVVSENTIVIYPARTEKAAQYEETMVKVFYLANGDAKKTVNLLRSMLREKDIHAHEELNAVVVRARPDAVTLAARIIEATDLAEAELMLEVSIMEINRNKATNLGIDLAPDAITAAAPLTNGAITLGTLSHLSSGDLLIGLPTAILNIKKEDLDANILANPRIRVKNNAKARIHIGDRVPVVTTTVNQGISTETIQYQDVGLKLMVEASVKQADEIDLKLNLEVSSIGAKTTTITGGIVYQIGTRNTETVLRLHDGETQVIGGLISDEERSSTTKIPFLGDIPVVGRLFASADNSKVKTEILLSITPHIIRRLELPDEQPGFRSGRADYPSSEWEGISPEAHDGRSSDGRGDAGP